MAKLYILPLIDETAKREKRFGYSESYSTYLALPFENVIRPMFLGGIKHFEGDEKILPLSIGTKANLKVKIDGIPKSFEEKAVLVFELPAGSHTIDIQGNFRKEIYSNRVPKKFNGDTNLQLNSNKAICLEEGDNFFVVTYKFKIECVKNVRFQGGPQETIGQERFVDVSHSSGIVDYATFTSYLFRYGKFEMEGITLPKAPTNKAKVVIKKDVANEPVFSSAIISPISNTKNEFHFEEKAVASALTYTNDEYFDVLLEGVSKKNDNLNSKATLKKEENITPLTFIKDTDTKYAELYEDGTLAYNTSATVYVPRSVKKLNPYFIKGDKTVKRLILPEGIEEIEKEEFKESALEELVLPKTLRSFKKSAIYGCNNLRSIQFEDGNPYFTTIDGVVYERKGGTLELFWYPPTKEDKSFTVASKCTTVGYQSVNNQHLYYLDLKGVTFVDMGAFQGSKKIREVIFSKEIKEIKSFAFDQTDLEEVSLPLSTKVGSFAFPDGCKVKKKLLFK